MRLARSSIGLGFVAFVLVAVACANDFDDLFRDGPDGGSPANDAATLNDAATEKDGDSVVTEGGTDGGADASTVCTPNGQCVNDRGCDAGTKTCATTCTGCPCNCGTQPCPGSDGNDRCESLCSAGAVCNIACQLNGPCNLTCDNCTSAKLDCQVGTEGCNSSCTAGSTCEETCNGPYPCTMSCAAGAKCKLACAPASAPCNLTCADGSKKDCGNGLFTCGQSCP